MSDRSLICSAAALTRVGMVGGKAVARSANRGWAAKWPDKAREMAAERGETLTDEEAARRGKALLRAHMVSLGRKSAKARKAAR